MPPLTPQAIADKIERSLEELLTERGFAYAMLVLELYNDDGTVSKKLELRADQIAEFLAGRMYGWVRDIEALGLSWLDPSDRPRAKQEGE